MQQLIHVKVDKQDLIDFDITLDLLKKLNMVSKDETRSSMIQYFIKDFPKANIEDKKQVNQNE